jgi:GNAT superfamily N-acetyltransferase
MSQTETEKKNLLPELQIEPLSKENWEQFLGLFGSRGACGNCWCMSFRLKNKEFQNGKTQDGNKGAMKKLVWQNKPTGILGFYQGRAIAWCAFAPRKDFVRLEGSRIHKPIDNKAVWSIPCFFVDKNFRRRQVSVALLRAVIGYAKKKKIEIIEAYPVVPTQKKLPDAFAWTGLLSAFEQAGFEVADRTSQNRPMVRYCTNGKAKT